jgi:hypothetical protein
LKLNKLIYLLVGLVLCYASSVKAESTIYLQASGGVAYGEEEPVFTGGVAYAHPTGLWLEFKGGSSGNEGVSFPALGYFYPVVSDSSIAVVGGMYRASVLEEPLYGGFGRLLVEIFSDQYVALDANFDKEETYTTVGYYIKVSE